MPPARRRLPVQVPVPERVLCTSPGAALNLSYRAPFQLHSAALDFSPLGTEVSALCPGQLSITATCTVTRLARWEGIPPGPSSVPVPEVSTGWQVR